MIATDDTVDLDCPITKQELERLAAFRFALRQFTHFSEEAARTAGLTPQQHQALLAIQAYPGRDRVRIRELAELLQVRHHSAVGLVNRLVALDLVERQPDRRDRRQVWLALTAHGNGILDELSAIHRAELRRIGPQLRSLLDSLERGKAEPEP